MTSYGNGVEAWSAEDRALAIRLWDEGRSGTEISKLLSVKRSRNAVCAYIHRLRLAGQVFNRPFVPPATKDSRGPAREARNFRPNSTEHRRPPRPYKERALAVVDMTHAKPWLERRFGECAYPVAGDGADTFSCCAPTTANYCLAHQKIVFAPSVQRNARAA